MKWHQILCVTCVLQFLAFPVALRAQRPADFGKQWVRTHPLTIMGLTQSPELFEFEQYSAAGMNTLLAWKNLEALSAKVTDDQYPIHVHMNDEKLTDDLKSRIAALHKEVTGPLAILMRDEPKTIAMPGVGEILQWIRSEYPETLVYSNAYPKGAGGKKYFGRTPEKSYSYGDYLSDFATMIRPDVLMFDVYPFRGESGFSSFYFQNLANIREEAQLAGIPYWLFVQSAPTPGARFPVESELRMQVFSSLAYGFTGIAYFTYDLAFARGLLDADGSPNDLYHAAKRVNQEVATLGQALRFLNSESVFYVSGRSAQGGPSAENPIPGGLDGWAAERGEDWRINRVRVVEAGEKRDVLIGLFTDDAGGHYFMVVNLWTGPHPTVAELTTSIEIQFASEVRSVSRLSRETGEVEYFALQDGLLRIRLPGGTGDLFTVENDCFPGLQ